ncbi:MAG: hypothetical protein Q9175_004055 [Cornicularia normoerica]
MSGVGGRNIINGTVEQADREGEPQEKGKITAIEDQQVVKDTAQKSREKPLETISSTNAKLPHSTTKETGHDTIEPGDVATEPCPKPISEPDTLVNDITADSRQEQGEDTSTSTSRSSVEAWLHQTTFAAEATDNSSRKRKRSSSDPSGLHTLLRWTEPFIRTSDRCNLLEDEMSNNQGQLPITPSSTIKSGKSKNKFPQSSDWISQRLRTYGLHQGDDDTFNKYKDFKEVVERILRGERSPRSIVKSSSAVRFKEKQRYFAKANEDTLVHNLIDCIIKPRRRVKYEIEEGIKSSDIDGTSIGDSSSEENREHILAEPDDNHGWVVAEYWDDGLINEYNLEFNRYFLPFVTQDGELTKNLEKCEGMTNPKPDFIYGINRDKYAIPLNVQISAEIQLVREVVPMMYDPVLIIEGKSDRGEAGVAENQACRSGAALVNAARMLREAIGDEDVEGADGRTFVFSATLCPAVMEIWVHWAEVLYIDGEQVTEMDGPYGKESMKTPCKKKHVLYHMNSLEQKALKNPDFLDKFRPFLHNVLDWGCIERFNQLRDLYARLYAWQKLSDEEKKKRQDGSRVEATEETAHAGKKRARKGERT